MSRPVVNGIPIITVGDGTTHGGTVISGSPSATHNNQRVARLGDNVNCPQLYPGGVPHGVNPIVEGESMCMVEGKPVALEGHAAACGCKLVAFSSTMPHAVMDTEDQFLGYSEKVELLNSSGGEAIVYCPYVVLADGKEIFSGRTDTHGRIIRVHTPKGEKVEVIYGDEALAIIEGIDNA